MKNTLKRMLCLLLAVIMTLGLTVGVLAEGEVLSTGIDGIEPSSLVLFEGDSQKLEPTVNPADYNMGYEWASSDEAVATVSGDGTVTAVAAGDADITVTVQGLEGAEASALTATCHVTVKTDSISKFSSEGGSTINGNGTLQLTAYSICDSGKKIEGAVSWESSDPDIATVTSKGLVSAQRAGSVTITAWRIADPQDNGIDKADIKITITDPGTTLAIEGSGVTGSKTPYSASMSVGGTLQLTAKRPDNSFDSSAIVWSSDKESVAAVDSSGKVTAVAAGTATIKASCDSASASVKITVGTPSSDITDSTTHGTTIKGLRDVEADLRAAFKKIYGAEPDSSATISFTPPGSTYGTLYKNSSTSSSNRVAKSTSYDLDTVRKMYFVPGSVGDYVLPYTLTSGDKTMKGSITISVVSRSCDITITLSDADKAYTFSSSSNEEKAYGTTLIKNAVSDACGKTYSYIEFGSPSSTSKKIGTLYANSGKKSLSTYDSYTYSTSGSSPVSKLYFVPDREGDYKISYVAYDNSGNELCSGSLIISVGGTADDATVTVTLDDDSSYTFSEKTRKEKSSAASLIDDAIYDESGKTYSYIKFGSVSSGSSVGTLYSNSQKTSVSTSRQYSRSTSANYSVSDLYFVPEKTGTYVRSFTAYDSNDRELLDGTLKIVVPGGSSSDDMDIYFNTTTGSTITLGEDVFASWFRQQKGSSYKLAYVTFDEVSRDYGTFKHSSSSFTPGGSTEYYSGSYSGSTGSGAKYLKNVKYTAGSSVGCISVDFTCYGGTSSSSSSTKLSGTFCIYVTKNSVKSISYDVKAGSPVTLDESSFASVHKNAMSTNSSSTKYYIELLEVPSKGTLHYNYTSSSKTGTKLTSSNFDNYEFHVNYSSSYDSVDDLTYVPAGNSSGSVSVRYLARDTDGEPMYVGSIVFNCGKEQAMSIVCGADGYTFKLSDFYSSGESDPVAYVTFRQPDSGELMLNYVNGRGVPLDSSVRLYTNTPSSGAYPISALTYIPKAGFSGNVSVSYTAVTESGKAQSGTMTIAVSSRKSSSRFKDVNSSGTGSWASDSIDFAYKWGLVNGTGEDTFSPDSTMSRAMLVAILYRAAGSPKVSGKCRFNDVPADAYYYDAVIWASDNGIVTGTSSTTFSPNRDVNREQVAAFLHRFAKYNGESVSTSGSLSGYTDQSSVSSYAIEPITWAVQRGYITSASATDKVLSPGGNATRAQVAVMVHRFLTY